MEFDPSYKVILTLFFRDFLELFFPDFAAEIDWSKPAVFLDKELEEITRSPKRNSRSKAKTVDLLAQVHTFDRVQKLCLLHFEVEARKSRISLGKRISRYLLRIDEKLGMPTMPIAIYLRLAGERIGWQTREITCFGHKVATFHFPYVGIRGCDPQEFLDKGNPFGLACIGLTRISPDERARIKAEALLRVEQLKLDERRREVLFDAVDTFTVLDENQQREFDRLMETAPYRKANEMRKSSLQIAREEGKFTTSLTTLVRVLEARFGKVSDRLRKKLEKMPADELEDLTVRASMADELSELNL